MTTPESKSQQRRIDVQSKGRRLFALRDANGNIVTDGYYRDKQIAKAARRFLNGTHTDDEGIVHENKGYTVSPGPDHHRWKGQARRQAT